jgi:hypothetical protein
VECGRHIFGAAINLDFSFLKEVGLRKCGHAEKIGETLFFISVFCKYQRIFPIP